MAVASRTEPIRIGVSGSSGFIGKHMSKALASAGMRVIAIPRSAICSGAQNTGAMAAALGGCQVVLHLAARAHVLTETSSTPLADYRAINRDATLAFAGAALQAGVRRFIFISSIGVNGNSSTRPFQPSDDPAPKDDYAISKYEAEQGLQEIAAKSGLEVVIIRPPLVYGPEVKGNFLRLLRLSASGIPLPLASVLGVRSLISVWNLCDLMAQCVAHPAAAGRILLAADGEDITLPQLICVLASAMDKPCRLFAAPLGALRAVTKAIGKGATFAKLTDSLQVDISETMQRLAWKPPLPLHAGLERTAQWYAREFLRVSART